MDLSSQVAQLLELISAFNIFANVLQPAQPAELNLPNRWPPLTPGFATSRLPNYAIYGRKTVNHLSAKSNIRTALSMDDEQLPSTTDPGPRAAKHHQPQASLASVLTVPGTTDPGPKWVLLPSGLR